MAEIHDQSRPVSRSRLGQKALRYGPLEALEVSEPKRNSQASGHKAQPAKQEQLEKRDLSEDERKEIREFLDRKRDRPRAPKVRVKPAPRKPLNLDFPSELEVTRFMSAFGTCESAFAILMLYGVLNAACEGGSENPPRELDINEALAAVTGIRARDEIEGMLATQMVATHVAAMTALRRLKGSETIPQQDSNGNLVVKLLRTYAAQVEALQRYRGKGQQKVTVEHVHVHAGGQAIVGTVNPGRGGKEKSEEQACAAREISYEPGTPLRNPDPEREPVPIAGGARKTPV
jgi:hypothetical protein